MKSERNIGQPSPLPDRTDREKKREKVEQNAANQPKRVSLEEKESVAR